MRDDAVLRHALPLDRGLGPVLHGHAAYSVYHDPHSKTIGHRNAVHGINSPWNSPLLEKPPGYLQLGLQLTVGLGTGLGLG